MNIRAESRLPWRDGDFDFSIVTFDHESGMLFLPEPNIQISTVGATARNPDFTVIPGAGRYPDIDGLFRVAEPDGQLTSRPAMHVLERQDKFGF